MKRKKVILFGATGSIGRSTLGVLRENRESFELVGVAAGRNFGDLGAIAKEFDVPNVAIHDEAAFLKARELGLFEGRNLLCGEEGLLELAKLRDAEIVVMAIVGTTGLKPTLAAIEDGKTIALASKEILVLAGKLVTDAARRKNVKILPVDSEHNAIFQCIGGEAPDHVAKLIITASGGRFRNFSEEEMRSIKPEDALQHPTWSMGSKITIDSSTMANKGLEIIEASWLFNKNSKEIDVVIHPQSLVHSMVQFRDGSILAQLSPPSMAFAIQHCLFYPDRAPTSLKTLDFAQAMTLEFEPPNLKKFPCLRLARECLEAGKSAPAIFNAANEIAVAAFLKERIAFLDIPRIIDTTLQNTPIEDPQTLDAILSIDTLARQNAAGCVG